MKRGFITNRLRSGKKSLAMPVEKKIEKESPRFKVAIKEEMESSKFGIF